MNSSNLKVKNIVVLNEITLESTEATTQAAASRIIVDTYFSEQLNLVCKYTTGAAETNNNAYVKVWGYIGTKSETSTFPYPDVTTFDDDIKGDTANWVQIGTFDLSSGTAVFTPTLFKIAGASAATTYTAHFALGITFSKIRVSAYEDGVAANKGTLTVVCSIQ